MRNDAGINGDAQRIEQIAWMLFLKVYDVKERDWEFDETNYASIIPDACRWANWAADDRSGSAMTGDRLLDFVNNTLFPVLKGKDIKDSEGNVIIEGIKVTAETPIKKAIVQTTFADANQYMKDGVLLANSGHFDVEIDKKALKALSVEDWERKPNIHGYRMPDGRVLNLLAEGRLVNLAAGNGHPAEIMDMSFAVQATAAEWLVKNKDHLECKMYDIPAEIGHNHGVEGTCADLFQVLPQTGIFIPAGHGIDGQIELFSARVDVLHRLVQLLHRKIIRRRAHTEHLPGTVDCVSSVKDGRLQLFKIARRG